MSIAEYISSGILESYALGMCNAEESREVESMIRKHPELRDELDQIEIALNAYASSYSKPPSDLLKERILGNIDQYADPMPSLKVVYKADERKMAPIASPYRMVIAASVTLFALSFIGNILLYNKYRSANRELMALNAEKQQLADNFKATQAKMENMHSELAVLTDPDMTKVMMKGVGKSPESLAMIYWNKRSKAVFLQVKNLPAPEAGKQYQLWAIVDGKPVDAGMLSVTPADSSLHPMKGFENAQAFAITLEKEGGSPTPTMSEMYVMGAVSL